MTRLRDLFPYMSDLPLPLRELGLGLDSPPGEVVAGLGGREFEALARACVAHIVEYEETGLDALLPALDMLGDRAIAGLRTNRARNSLEKARIRTWRDLARLTPRDVRLLPNVGALTVGDILSACVTASIRPIEGEQASATAVDDQLRESPERFQFISFLSLVAAWAASERGLKRLGDLLRLDPDGGQLPDSLREAWEKVAALPPEAIADASIVDVSIADLLEGLLSELEPNHRRVFELRVLADQPKTLEEAGHELGVTRERARQIQIRAEEQVASLLRSPRYQLLRWRASDLRAVLGLAAPAGGEDTLAALDWCLRGLDGPQREIGRQILLNLAGPYRKRDGWLELVDAPRVTPQELVALADENGLLALNAAHDWLSSRGVDTAFQDAWIDRTGRFRRLGDRLAVWNGSLVDKSVALLAAHAVPMDVERLVREIGEGHNPRGARDRFFGDRRLMRINRSQWALRSWGLEEYTGITDEIAQRIEASGGRADLQTLIDEITTQFDVRPGSVKVYTEAPMFVIEGSSVRLRGDDEPFPISGHVSGCRGAFLSAIDRVSVVLPVDKDTTRGSGRGCAPRIAELLGISPGRPRTWHWAEGELAVTWPRTAAFGPSIGSTRALARSVDAVEGDSIRLDFELAVGEVRCHRIPAIIDSMVPADAIELLTGIELEGVDPLTAIASALRVPPGEVRRRLVERGDTLLASLLPRPEVDASLEAALRDLADVLDELA